MRHYFATTTKQYVHAAIQYACVLFWPFCVGDHLPLKSFAYITSVRSLEIIQRNFCIGDFSFLASRVYQAQGVLIAIVENKKGLPYSEICGNFELSAEQSRMQIANYIMCSKYRLQQRSIVNQMHFS